MKECWPMKKVKNWPKKGLKDSLLINSWHLIAVGEEVIRTMKTGASVQMEDP